ncbi:MAG TPA: ABC transporter permease, partial [Gemmataceae bacterium]|nr:ABC transporter permease [Gemmataceae bacterium]
EIIRQTSLLGIFAIGSAIVIIAGGIDLSSGSVIAFSGSVFAALLLLMDPAVRNADHPVSSTVLIIAALGTLVVGLLIGSLHAWLITVINLPPFVATLATLVGLRSLARVLINDVVPNFVPSQSGSQINIARNQFVDLAQNVWFLAAVFLVVALACWILMSKTVVGRHLHALGGNEQAARLSGIRTDRLKWLAYCISALLASVAGILYVGDSTLADPQTAGQGYELNAIAAAVVGGCSLMGGIGTVPGTVLGALFLRVVMDAVNKIVNKNAAVYEGLIVGSVVVLAVAFSQVRLAWQRGKPFFAGPLGLVTILNMSLGTGILAIVLAADARWARSLGAGKLGLFAALLMAVILSVLRIVEARGRARLAARTVSGTIRS